MIRIGTTTLPVAGWAADPRNPDASRELRLAAIRQVVTGYGLAAVELTLDFAAVYPQVFDAGFYRAVADLQQELGFICTAHLPFLWVAPSSLNESLRQASTDCLCRAVEATEGVEVQTYVLHLWGSTSSQIAIRLDQFSQPETIIAGMMGQARRSLTQLCDILDPRDLCLENLDDPLFEAALPLVKEFGASICLDVGHLPWRGDSEQEFLAQHGRLIREVHLHDAVGALPEASTLFRDHLSLGSGQIDYLAFLSALEAVGYEGAVILEMNSQKDLEESLERVKSFL